MNTRYRGRFAPSPTGLLHLGNARTALLAWLDARANNGVILLRMEDLDGPRTVAGMAEQQLKDLAWLGLTFDQGPVEGGPHAPYVQSQRQDRYTRALDKLIRQGRAFACTCSRKDLQRLASAPHQGEEGPAYPGTCRGRYRDGEDARARGGREPAWRFQVDAGVVTWRDRVLGPQQQDVTVDVGDVVIKRADGLWAYQLAVVVDDLEMGVTDVVRAADLTSSTARQLQLARALGGVPPAFAHVPLMNAPDGTRLQKREPRHTLAGLRDAGVAPEAVVGFLAHSVGLHPLGRPCKPQDLVEDFSLGRLHEQTDWSRLP